MEFEIELGPKIAGWGRMVVAVVYDDDVVAVECDGEVAVEYDDEVAVEYDDEVRVGADENHLDDGGFRV